MSNLILLCHGLCSPASTSAVPEEAEQGFECVLGIHLSISRCVADHYKITSIPIKKWGGYQDNHGRQCSCCSAWEPWTSRNPSLSVLWCIHHSTNYSTKQAWLTNENVACTLLENPTFWQALWIWNLRENNVWNNPNNKPSNHCVIGYPQYIPSVWAFCLFLLSSDLCFRFCTLTNRHKLRNVVWQSQEN